MKKLLIALSIGFYSFGFAQDVDYNIAKIPENLKRNAKSVVRHHKQNIKILDKGNASLEVFHAVSILEEGAYDRAIFAESYDKYHKLRNIKITIYDEQGKEAKKIRKEDLTDASLSMEIGELFDTRMKYVDPDYKYFPFTIEFQYDLVFTGFMSFPDWSPYTHYDESVELAQLEITTKSDYSFKYLERNGIIPANVQSIGSEKVYTWKMTDLPALDVEPFSPYFSTFPTVHLAPVEFEMDGYVGDNTSWSQFGAWIAKLNAGKNNLSEESKAKIRAIIENISDKKEKVAALYKYMQNRTRYVNIQLGIGGWQPFDANTVERLGYGDCKALTNYMKSILEVVDIPSNYVLVSAGENQSNIIVDFPSNQFNHAFLMVPMADDTVWLECTSQQIPFGTMGSFTDDRDVLVIEENGGKLVHTPVYSPDQNYRKRTAEVTLLDNGSAKADVKTLYAGAQFMEAFPNLLREKEEVKKDLYNEIEIPDFTIADLNFVNESDQLISQDLKLAIHSFAKKTQNRLIMPISLMNKVTHVPPKDDERKIDVFIRRSFTEEDIITYHIPADFHLGSHPENVEIQSKFGIYSVSVEEKDGILEYKRTLKINKGTYPPEEYNNLVDFISKIAKADRMKVLLVSGT